MTFRYRAVGIDLRAGSGDGLGGDRDEQAWVESLGEARSDRDILRAADPPFDVVLVEQQSVTYGRIKTVPDPSPRASEEGSA